jgi:hypothetical protein
MSVFSPESSRESAIADPHELPIPLFSGGSQSSILMRESEVGFRSMQTAQCAGNVLAEVSRCAATCTAWAFAAGT